MHALIVLSHPAKGSLTHAIAQQVAAGVQGDGAHSFDIADLAEEGFDPRFTRADIDTFAGEASTPADVLAEQARIDRADALVLVYPVYWWSMPALLKGWIDRVFIHGWAFEDKPGRPLSKKLGHLPVHLVAIGGADMRTYARHGYFGSMRNQIDHGIFGYCGAPVIQSELLLMPDADNPLPPLQAAHAIGKRIFSTPIAAA